MSKLYTIKAVANQDVTMQVMADNEEEALNKVRSYRYESISFDDNDWTFEPNSLEITKEEDE